MAAEVTWMIVKNEFLLNTVRKDRVPFRQLKGYSSETEEDSTNAWHKRITNLV